MYYLYILNLLVIIHNIILRNPGPGIRRIAGPG